MYPTKITICNIWLYQIQISHFNQVTLQSSITLPSRGILFNSPTVIVHFARSIHRTSTTDHSVFHHITLHLNHLKALFNITLSERFPFGIGLDITTHEDAQGTIIEVTLTSAKCEKAVATSLVVDNQTFTASLAGNPNIALLKVNLSKTPIMPIEKLKSKLLNNFVRYAVSELVIYPDDWAQCWFYGNRCVYLERSLSTGIKLNFSKTLAFSLSESPFYYLAQCSRIAPPPLQPISFWHDKISQQLLIYLGYPVYTSVSQRNMFIDQLLLKIIMACDIHSQWSLSTRGRVTVLNALIFLSSGTFY